MSNFLHAFTFVFDNGQLRGLTGVPTLVHLTLETLKVAMIGMGIALVIALPIGVWLGHVHRFSFVAINLATSGGRCRAWQCWRSAWRSSAWG
jgi:osmoprotectant transport system permease protein